MLKGPRPNEVWTVGSYKNLKFIGIAIDFEYEKFLVFEDPINGLFVINRDKFWSADLFKEKTNE